MKSEESFAFVDDIRKELRCHREKESPFGRSLNFAALQQTFNIESRGLSYIMYVINERPQDSCRNVNEQVSVVILLSCLCLLDEVINPPSFGCDGTFSFASKFPKGF